MAYPLGQPTTLATAFATKLAKSSAKTKKKSSAFDGLSSFDIFALLRQKMNDGEETTIANSEGEEDDQESKASLEASVTNNDHNSFCSC